MLMRTNLPLFCFVFLGLSWIVSPYKIRSPVFDNDPSLPSHIKATIHTPNIHVATLNVKFDGGRNNPVPIPPHGAIPPSTIRSSLDDAYRELPWAQRRSRIVDALLSTGELDIAGFQEVYYSQLQDLASLLGPSYSHVGVGRDDGVQAGEYSPIFWDNQKFSLVDWTTIWLSTSPNRPGSIGWDASQTRIATLLSLRIKGTSELFHVANTHYDDRGVNARAQSSLLIRKEYREWVKNVETKHGSGRHGDSLVLLIGDFNAPDNEAGFKNIISPLPLPNGHPSFTFMDSFSNVRTRHTSASHSSFTTSNQRGGRSSLPYGPIKTYTGFTAPGRTPTERIDFIMMAAAAAPEPYRPGGRDRYDQEKEEREQDADEPELASRDVAVGGSKGRGGWWFRQYACVDNWIEEGDVMGWQGRWSDHRAVRVTVSRGL